MPVTVQESALHEITRILTRGNDDPKQIAAELLPLVYEELRRLAVAMMAKLPPGQTLQATALVHEAYMRVADNERPSAWENRRHFFSTAARAMRFILVDQARRKSTVKHGGSLARSQLDDVLIEVDVPPEDILALDDALQQLEADDRRKAEIVQLRYFAGLSEPETAEVLGVSRATVAREWRYARVWLLREMSGETE